MIICNNTNKGYSECLDMMLPTWKQQGCEIDLYNFDGNTFDEHCTNKIKAIKECLIKHKGQNIAYLDTDVMMMKPISEDIFTHDIIATRMVTRLDKDGVKDINAGVSFWKANDKTIQFCDEWLELDKKYQGQTKYPEQKAFSDLCYKYYDKGGELKIGNVSERLYNFEHDNVKIFLFWIPKYMPYLVHFKTKRWADKKVVDVVRGFYNPLPSPSQKAFNG
jgi:hypothetical protein